MRVLLLNEESEKILNRIFNLAAKGAQATAIEQYESMLEEVKKYIREGVADEEKTKSKATAAVSENVSAEGASGAVHNN